MIVDLVLLGTVEWNIKVENDVEKRSSFYLNSYNLQNLSTNVSILSDHENIIFGFLPSWKIEY